jgi:hypothetical protein
MSILQNSSTNIYTNTNNNTNSKTVMDDKVPFPNTNINNNNTTENNTKKRSANTTNTDNNSNNNNNKRTRHTTTTSAPSNPITTSSSSSSTRKRSGSITSTTGVSTTAASSTTTNTRKRSGSITSSSSKKDLPPGPLGRARSNSSAGSRSGIGGSKSATLRKAATPAPNYVPLPLSNNSTSKNKRPYKIYEGKELAWMDKTVKLHGEKDAITHCSQPKFILPTVNRDDDKHDEEHDDEDILNRTFGSSVLGCLVRKSRCYSTETSLLNRNRVDLVTTATDSTTTTTTIDTSIHMLPPHFTREKERKELNELKNRKRTNLINNPHHSSSMEEKGIIDDLNQPTGGEGEEDDEDDELHSVSDGDEADFEEHVSDIDDDIGSDTGNPD